MASMTIWVCLYLFLRCGLIAATAKKDKGTPIFIIKKGGEQTHPPKLRGRAAGLPEAEQRFTHCTSFLEVRSC